uniref:Uncharacterized protein n=1 Tax=Solanum lycopersicum TaxID=4081 RepID=A0A3Q7J901_SOLLC
MTDGLLQAFSSVSRNSFQASLLNHGFKIGAQSFWIQGAHIFLCFFQNKLETFQVLDASFTVQIDVVRRTQNNQTA